MYYRLKSDYILRGWEKAAGMLIERRKNKIYELTRKEFEAFILCDGETDLTDEILDETMRNIIQLFQARGVIEPCSEPCKIEKEQYYQYYHNRYVHSVFWSITGKCNYRCRHCYMDAPDGALGELSTQQAFDIIDQMAECGVLQVELSGGEPFVRKDLWQLIDRMLSYKIAIDTIYTNGWLLNEVVLDAFEQRGIKPAFSISFDGVGWHDWMRGVPGAEKAALRALKLCQKRGYKTDVEICVHRGNIDTLPQTIEALCSVGVQNVRVGNVAETALWNRNCDGNAMPYQEYLEKMIPYIEWYYRAGQPIESLIISSVAVLQRGRPCKIAAEKYDGTEKCLNCYMCGAARMSCYITPEGRLLPCMPMTASPQQEKFPLVQDIGLKQGLSDSYYMQFVNGRIKDLFAENAECNACQYRYKCGGGCRASALLDGNRQLMGCDRTMCLLWKGGYVDRIRQVADEAEAKYGAAQNTL